MLKTKLLNTAVLRLAITLGLSAFALFSSENSDAAESRGRSAKELKLGPGLPLGPQWHRDAASLEKPSLLLSPREKESRVLIQRIGPLSGTGNASRGPSSNSVGEYSTLSS